MGALTTPVLISVAGALLTYHFLKWFRNPLRNIPGPHGLPFLGNVLSITPTRLHMILYDWALKYGDVMKISVFNTPMVVINNTEVAYDVLGRTGSDFQGRPESPRAAILNPKDLAFASVNEPGYIERRNATVRALKAYGDGVEHLENIIQDSLVDLVEDITKQDGRPVDTHNICNGYLCCVMASVVFGEKHSYDDPLCHSIHQMNQEAMRAMIPVSAAALLDIFPFLVKQNILLKRTVQQFTGACNLVDQVLMPKIHEYKSKFDETEMKGILDQLIAIQREGGDGGSTIDNTAIRGIILNLIIAGMETSLTILCQALLELLHEPELQKRIQNQIDSQFEPAHVITLQDRNKLPLLQALILECLRYVTPTPILLPHMTIKDTQAGGYKIPAKTIVLVNGYYISHNPDVYDEPFKVKPKRFLDEDGNVVPPGHPAKYNSLVFGSGKRICIGKNLAESRIFLFLAHILQKFTIEPVGELPNRDVRNYKLDFLITPPAVNAMFKRRQQ